MKDLQSEFDMLLDEIETHDTAYHMKNNPLISDPEYDALTTRLNELAVKLNIPHIPDIGKDAAPIFTKITREVPMLSIRNTYTSEGLIEKFEKFANKGAVRYIATLKVDGIALELTYTEGNLTQATTRGDGIIGDSILDNILIASDIPTMINTSGTVVVRGELYLLKPHLANINRVRIAKGKEIYKTARSACFGIAKTAFLPDVQSAVLQFAAYGIYQNDLDLDTQLSMLSTLKDLTFETVPILKVGTSTVILNQLQVFEREVNISLLPIDGVVIAVDDLALCADMGATSQAPKWCVAYKFDPERKLTKLLSIRWQASRSGTYTPVGQLEPVSLSGNTVTKVQLFNLQFLRFHDIRVGDSIWMEKAGEVIPHFISVNREARDGCEVIPEPPSECVFCRGPLIERDSKCVCVNNDCISRVVARLAYFVSKPCLNILKFGPKLIEKLFEAELINVRFDSLFMLTFTDLKTVVGHDHAIQLLDGLEHCRNVATPYQLLTAFGIPNVGTSAATILMDEFKSIPALIDASYEEIEALPSIGPVTAANVVNYFANKLNHDVTLKLVGKFYIKSVKPPVKYKHWAVTGAIKGLSRTKLVEVLTKNSIALDSSVTNRTELLIIGSGHKDTGKFKRAMELNIPTLAASTLELFKESECITW